MEILFFIPAWVVGGLVGALTLGQIFILARFGIPTAVRWYRCGWLTAPTPVSRYIISLVFLTIVFAVATWIAVRFSQPGDRLLARGRDQCLSRPRQEWSYERQPCRLFVPTWRRLTTQQSHGVD